MRLIVEITPRRQTPQPLNTHLIQGLIYRLLRGSQFEALHEKLRYKFFCFSNIFPFVPNKPLEEGEHYNILISSPSTEFINCLNKQLGTRKELKLGSFGFFVKRVRPLTVNLVENSTIRTETPVVISIPESLFGKYNIDSRREYLYWNSEMALNAFVDAVSKNSVRKFNAYYDKNFSEDLLLFQTFKFKRGALVRYKDADIAGSIWEFTPNPDTKAQKVLQFILDVGLGEKNSAGFGFLNVYL